MKKRIFGKMIVFTLTAILFIGSAANYMILPVQAEENMGEESIDAEELPELPDSDELFRGYVDHLFYKDLNDGITMYGNVGAEKLTDSNEKKMYNELKAGVKKIADGKSTSTIITVGGLNLSASTWGSCASKVMSYLMMDCPYDLYWYDKTRAGGVSFRGSGYGSVSQVEFTFKVAKEYQGSNDTTINPSTANTVQTAVSNANSIVSRHSSESDRDKLKSYCQEICDLVDYNHAAADTATSYGNPWQLIWVFDNNPDTKVVCEGYAKAFQYLCDLSDFRESTTACYTVTGGIPGGHMWNIVTLEGKNYLADITNSDSTSIGQDGSLFLAVPVRGTVDTSYTFNNTNGQSITYFYDDDQAALFGKKILRLSGTDEPEYDEPASRPENPPTPETNPDPGTGTNPNPGTTSGTQTKPGTVTKPAASASKTVTLSLNGQKLKNNTTLKVTYKKKYTFKATVTDKAGKILKGGNGKITWSTSNKKIATVTSGGKVTVKKKAGTVTITAKTADGKKAKVKLKASKSSVKVTKVKITGSKTMSLKKKKTQTLKVTITPASAANQKVTWKSSNKKIATVNSK